MRHAHIEPKSMETVLVGGILLAALVSSSQITRGVYGGLRIFFDALDSWAEIQTFGRSSKGESGGAVNLPAGKTAPPQTEVATEPGVELSRHAEETGLCGRDGCGDGMIARVVRDTFMHDPRIGTRIGIGVRDGVVNLSGVVRHPGIRAAAEQDARSIKGVTGVDNRIEIGFETP